MNRLAILLLAGAAGAFAQSVTITTPSPLPTGYVNVPYSDVQTQGVATFNASTNPPGQQITWSLVVGIGTGLPPGLGFNQSNNVGFLSGTPTQTGNFTFRLRAQFTGNSNVFSIMDYAISIANPSLVITPPPIPDGVVNQFYSFTLQAAATPPLGVTFSLNDGSLPNGITVSPSGVISGSPANTGTFNFTVQAQLGNSNVTTLQSYSFTIFAGQVVITTTTLPPAPVFEPYGSPALTANVAGATFSVVTGNTLPPGIQFDGVAFKFFGTPNVTGAYPILMQASFPGYLPGTRTLTLYVTNGPLRIVDTTLPVAIQGQPYSVTLTASGGLSPFQWSPLGTNPANMTLNANTGALTGTPPNQGVFTLPVTLSDAAGEQVSAALSLTVAAPLSVITASLPNGSVGLQYSQNLQAGGGQAPFRWTLASNSGSLPPGLTLSTAGTIGGNPTANGTYNFTVQVTDNGNRTATKALTIIIGAGGGLTITTSSLPDGSIGAAYSATLAASGGTAPYVWSITSSGALPPGLALDARAGTISGTPTTLGTYTFTVQATDSTVVSAALTAQKTFTLTVGLPLSISTTSLPGATAGTSYTVTLQAAGGKPPYTWSIGSGTLPAGLQLNASTGVISGTATTAGTSSILAVVTDSNGQSARQQLTLTVTAQGNPLTFTNGSVSTTTGGSISQALAASGGTPPYTFALTGGTLPAGVTFNAQTGSLSGTPTAAGTTTLTFTVTDANRQTASGTITITVNAPAAPAVSFSAGSSSPKSNQQPAVTASFDGALTVDVTVDFTVSFQSAVGGNDPAVQFITSGGGTSKLTVTVPKGSTQVPFPAGAVLATGTTAGTITITKTVKAADGTVLSPSPSPTTYVISPDVPVIQSVALSNTGGSLTVTVTGYTNTHEATLADFVFTSASGATIANNGDVPVQVGAAFSAYSFPLGGSFKLTVPFTLANGTASQIVSVRATVTNKQGASAPVNPQ